MPLLPQNAITLETAQNWTRKFNSDPTALIQVKSFKIPGSNIRNIMKDGVVDVRAYFGINDDGDPALMLVGVDHNGNDMIDMDNEYHIYDFSQPCPSSCNKMAPFVNLADYK